MELHPLTRVGALDFLGHVKRIRQGSQVFTGYGPPQLTAVLKKKLTVQRRQVGEVAFVRLVGTKTGNNHWELRGRVAGAPESLADGTRIRLDILQGNQVLPGALGISAVAIAGTAANTAVQTLASGDVVAFQALIRMHLPTILDHLSDTATEINPPWSSCCWPWNERLSLRVSTEYRRASAEHRGRDGRPHLTDARPLRVDPPATPGDPAR